MEINIDIEDFKNWVEEVRGSDKFFRGNCSSCPIGKFLEATRDHDVFAEFARYGGGVISREDRGWIVEFMMAFDDKTESDNFGSMIGKELRVFFKEFYDAYNEPI